MIRFADRREAGQRLAAKLVAYKDRADVIVLGIPRGGVVVAAEIARALAAPLDIFITRKIGAPFNKELAIGAVASDGTVFVDRALIHELRLSEQQVAQASAAQIREIHRRVALYRRDRPPLDLQNKVVILTDDGVATGATTLAALRALKKQNPQRVVLAVPVAPRPVVPHLREECDELVLLDAPEPFFAVGYFYEDFGQVTDDEVIELLHAAA
jgi:putative phosphoribosyl transferase